MRFHGVSIAAGHIYGQSFRGSAPNRVEAHGTRSGLTDARQQDTIA